ncbi:hypothetical protein BO70DRAFT_365634 [Aspergillus heteromorphus CBS 117.55]|uniref:Altered inheritance of mitochondria protein 6 n=1 Tax=Aspergillus heteromorphus CBS 117.55 TaxID=1448321 RepID=A0A317V8M6_9EURO|nr:uncharacterized protein BO70DRAFT_365634 [Aspergillus heteromorphus CBS 117.55]PWY69709.1 hypothetical protein BO70DRAFT_365634 [Aspergillus heteromorphus CBS 117.55]
MPFTPHRPIDCEQDDGSSSSPLLTKALRLEAVPEEDADIDEAEFEALPLGNLKARRRRARKNTLSRRSRLNDLCRSLWACRHVYCNIRPLSRRAVICRAVKRPFWGLVILLGLLRLVSFVWSGLVYLFPDDLDARLDAWVFPAGRPSIFSHWTTHGVVPVRCHSHNDYWRDVPLHSALNAGCIGVEADIWLSGDDLLVGHTPFTLHHEVTLQSLYLSPLLDLLQKHNTRSSQLEPVHQDGTPRAGVFANDPTQTLTLLIDFKGNEQEYWTHLVDQLQPLRDGGYLTYFNGSDIIPQPITIVATGDAPFHHITANETYRDIFYDAPLDKLPLPNSLPLGSEPDSSPQAPPVYTSENSYYASVDFRKTVGSLVRNRFSQEQLRLVRAQIEAAHARGLKVRYWGTPSWPRGLRNHVWHVLVREGVDLINVDDLREATRQDWRKHRSWFF